MHLFPALYNSNCETVIFGDTKAESRLIRMLIEEQRDDQLREKYGPGHISQVRTRTCILYPTTDSILLPKWVSQHLSDTHTPQPAGGAGMTGDTPARTPEEECVINMVVLDGTYSQAARQVSE